MITDNLTTSVYFSDLLPEKCPTLNQHIAKALDENWIRYAYLSETKDIWCRDFMPIQITEDRFGRRHEIRNKLKIQSEEEQAFACSSSDFSFPPRW